LFPSRCFNHIKSAFDSLALRSNRLQKFDSNFVEPPHCNLREKVVGAFQTVLVPDCELFPKSPSTVYPVSDDKNPPFDASLPQRYHRLMTTTELPDPALHIMDPRADFFTRLVNIASDIQLSGFDQEFVIRIGVDEGDSPTPSMQGRLFYQVKAWRRDVITGTYDWGFSGKAYLSPHATDSELVQTIFGLYKAFFEHEARETFTYRGARVFGPHIDVMALHSVARRVDVRSAQHMGDKL
jgi:hypothetical protein